MNPVVTWRSALLPTLAAGLFAAGAASRQTATTPKVDYINDVFPIFKAHCGSCHSPESAAGGFRLDTAANVEKGGDSGPGFIKGQSAKSILMERLLGHGGKPQMPLGFKPLTSKQIETIKVWIDGGAVEKIAGRGKHWAFELPVKPTLPVPTKNPIDAFVLARLDRENLKPSPPADKVTLIRRVTLDLTGLNPTPAEVDAYLADKAPNAFERVVDRLLASPHYGERMALPWLDAARYADSNGFQQDGDTHQYVWRDWVIRALNANMPFSRFTQEQLAGDLLPNPTRDQLIATAFNRNHMLNGEGGAIPEEQRSVNLFDRVDTTSTVWMGLTMACARCHDHKYDPLSQKDYYAMMAYFNNVPETGVPAGGGQYRIADPWIYAGTPDQMRRMEILERDLKETRAKAKPFEDALEGQEAWESNPAGASKEILDLLKIARDKRDQGQKDRIRNAFLDAKLTEPGRGYRSQVQAYERELNSLRNTVPRVMVMSDAKPRKTHLFIRGNYESLGEELKPAVPVALLPKPDRSTGIPVGQRATNRLGLANWILSPHNPLTARVQVNRNWQLFFGRGLVKTPEDFGVQSEPPSHPELLDWLAIDFRESGWNVKRLHKLIVMSDTYRQSSRLTPELKAKDPENRLLARGARFRMPSMLLRDMALGSSGLLYTKMYGKPVYPYQPKGIWDGLNITLERNFEYPQSKGIDNHRRSIYTFWRRTAAPGNMFDASPRNACTVSPSMTSTPLHALTMLNDVTWVEAGRALALRVMPLKTPEARLTQAFRLVCARRPSPDDLKVLTRSLNRAIAEYENNPEAAKAFLSQGDSPVENPTSELAAYAAVCQMILNLDEAMTRE